MKKATDKKRCLFLQFPYISLLLPVALRYGKHIILLQAETSDDVQKQKGITNKTIIRKWDILSLRTQIGQC
ncbi:hypothetical protein HMPREF9145_2496 [Segatella salivae F0493]|uniref:Uncharacterized protein n=1 Tax=Segatella salivae F0493 TaxID=1395125 RepID=U2MIT8_9BACT|nr:hypothetical protein HMPREF9145_2496 [Segatella salivae F0493]